MEVRSPVKKLALALLLGLAPAAIFAQVVVRIAPPEPIVETHDRPPHDGYVWQDGYHRWDGHKYVWVRGKWVRPPHRGAKWVAHRWEKRDNGYVMVQGHWE